MEGFTVILLIWLIWFSLPVFGWLGTQPPLLVQAQPEPPNTHIMRCPHAPSYRYASGHGKDPKPIEMIPATTCSVYRMHTRRIPGGGIIGVCAEYLRDEPYP